MKFKIFLSQIIILNKFNLFKNFFDFVLIHSDFFIFIGLEEKKFLNFYFKFFNNFFFFIYLNTRN
jgi:hypothetical protein